MKAALIAQSPQGYAAPLSAGRSEATRNRLISVAEQLFAEKGVQAVSLNEINKAAQQRHGSACQYHFGNKDGLIQAILDKHVPAIARERDIMFDEMEADGSSGNLTRIVRAFVQPVASKLLDPDGGKQFVRLNAQLVAIHTLGMRKIGLAPFLAPHTERLNHIFEGAMEHRAISPEVTAKRLLVASVMLYHGLADFSRVLEAAGALDQANVQIFASDLQTMILAALTAPFA
jgi:AcrR family transcriptional regulator